MAKTKHSQPSRSRSGKSKQRAASAAKQLERIDKQLIELLQERARRVAESAGPPRRQIAAVAEAQQRLATLLEKTKLDSPLTRAGLQGLMQQIVGYTMASASEGKIAFLGPEYSYSHLAAIKCFGEHGDLVPVASIEAVFEAIVRHDCVAGLVPVENSTDGRVVDTLGMFLKHDVRICGEVLLPIDHNLLSRTPRNEITEVYSKPQALSQCRRWLAQNLPGAKLVEMSSTAAAARLAAERRGAAAVASLEAGSKYGLDAIASSIQDNKANVTRFAMLGNDPTKPSGKDKTSLLFQVAHQPGALADAMGIFKRGGLNLTWIESFPMPGKPNEYFFFVELEGHEHEVAVRAVIDKLEKKAERCEVLGSYPRASALQ